MRESAFLPPIDLPVLGVPTRFLVTDPLLAGRVDEAFGAWRAVTDRTELLSRVRVVVRLRLHDGPEDDSPAPVAYRWPTRDRFTARTRGSEGVADLAGRSVDASVTPALAEDGAHFRHAFLSALVLATVTVHDRVPIHAAAVARADTALLLHGRSGVGKSSLAFAAVRAGLRLLSEDTVFVERRSPGRLWGMPGPIHLLPDARHLFPDERFPEAHVLAGGTSKHAFADFPAGPHLPVAHRAATVLLQRSEGLPALHPATIEEVRAALAGASEAGFDMFSDRAARAADFVGGAGAWRLSIGGDPHRAAALLARLLPGEGA